MTGRLGSTVTIAVPEPPSHWSQTLRQEYEDGGCKNGHVGHKLLSETKRVRVWFLSLEPGERVGFHRHQLDYFWTALSEGASRSNFADGSVLETNYEKGKTQHFRFAEGACMIHDLENIGTTTLSFTTVEFLDSQNPPLPVD